MILVDTSVWIDFLMGVDSAQHQALHRLIEEEEDICITEIILTEILQGIKRDKDFETTKDYLMAFSIVKANGNETYLRATRIYRDCRKKGKTVRKTIDCIIAAVCIENRLTLLHKDSDYDRVRECTGLKVYKV